MSYNIRANEPRRKNVVGLGVAARRGGGQR
jgi:hypothetical protein